MARKRQQFGTISCDFIPQSEFLSLCEAWLESKKLHHVITLNPEMVLLAQTHPAFATATNNASLRVPDGAGLFWARAYLNDNHQSLFVSLARFPKKRTERLTGVDMVWDLARLCEQHHQSLYLLGGSARESSGTITTLRKKFPELSVYAAPYHTFDISGPASILHDIQTKQPAVLLVAYGAPQQTLWIENNAPYLSSVSIATGVGGAFTIISGLKRRAPWILRRLNAEWVWRLLLEPKRFYRIINAVVHFPRFIAQQKKSLHADKKI